MDSTSDTGINNALKAFGFSAPDMVSVGDPGLSVSLLKTGLLPSVASTAQWRQKGRVPHPINMENARKLMFSVDIQETCILTKRDATVGMGFESEDDIQQREKKKELDQHAQDMALGRTSIPGSPPKPPAPVAKADPEGVPPPDKTSGDSGAPSDQSKDTSRSKVEQVLDPLCEFGFQALLNQCGEDFENTGNFYIEVVRDGTKPAALWHMPAPMVYVFNEEKKPHYHFEVSDGNGTLKYVRFGDLDRFKKDNPHVLQEQITELIHVKVPTSMDPHYGLPEWVACVPWLELAQMMLSCHFDFFQNRAVPDLLILLTGGKVSDGEMKGLQNQIRETVGPGKRFRSLLASIGNPNIEAHIERLASEQKDTFADLWSTVQLKIVSSHRIPPLLAGVTLPGKMAATNELPNALIAFQTLYISPKQRLIELVLGKTLGSPEAGLGLTPADFRLKKITDAYDMGQVDTMSRMRETATEAQMTGRKLENGLKK